MSTITPTVGRKVWHYSARSVGRKDDLTPFDATVIYVNVNGSVDLLVTDHRGDSYPVAGMDLRDPSPNDRHGVEAYATWMPYQIGQAKQSPLPPILPASGAA